jgi:alpha-glucosidase
MSERPWWQKAVIYQIYPRSFQDTNGDGVGDLAGILQRVDYLAWLGVDAVWISPFYPSPMADFGYDIADYVDVDPLFGTLADFDLLIAALHRHAIRVILDFVPNHSSDAHPWFRQSRASRSSPKRDWYIWRDGRPHDGAPNNWQSFPTGSAWEKDSATGQYYLHSFLVRQPDLNWGNLEVRAAMYDVLRFWLARGVDGFRVDVLWHLIKDAQFRDDPANPHYCQGDPPYQRLLPLHSADQPEVIKAIEEMRDVLEEFPGERLLIGEVYLPLERLVAYYGPNLRGTHFPFNFGLMWVSWKAADVLQLIRDYEAALPPSAWPSWVLGNHDQPRVASRLGPAQARVGMMLLLTLRGTPTLYYGDELGLEDVPISPEEVRDSFGLSVPGQGRDPERTPMPWNDFQNAGFTAGHPWLPLGKDHPAMSVAVQQQNENSMLALTRELLDLRRRELALSTGDWAPAAVDGDVLAYMRGAGDSSMIVVLNLDSVPKVVRFAPDVHGAIVLSTLPGRRGEAVAKRVELRGDEGIVIRAVCSR